MRRMNRKSYSYHGVSEGETEEAQRLRFQVELEFVQCLASPNYLHFLAQRNYFKEQSFVNYLKYLQYWKEPEYAKYLKYPMCLYFLDLLQHENFRKEIVNGQCAKFIDDQMILHWQHYTRKRMKILETGTQQQPLLPGSLSAPAVGGGGGTPSHASPGLHSTSAGANTGNNSPAACSIAASLPASHTTVPSAAALVLSSLNNTCVTSSSGAVFSPANLNSALLSSPILSTGSGTSPASAGSVNTLAGNIPAGVIGSPRGSSPGNLSPANVLNGHQQKML